jgi:hypothetical protein
VIQTSMSVHLHAILTERIYVLFLLDEFPGQKLVTGNKHCGL